LTLSWDADQQPVEDKTVPGVAHGTPSIGDEGKGAWIVDGTRLVVDPTGVGAGVTIVNWLGDGSGLSPAPPISTEPKGIPTADAPTDDDGNVAPGDAAPPLVLEPHVPELAAPPGDMPPTVIPPPS
jgi:hypothetical protein